MDKFPLYHVGPDGCDKVAFYTTRKLIAMVDNINTEDVILLNGEKPIDGVTPMVCGSCGKNVFGSDNLEYKDPDVHGQKILQIYAIDESGERFEITDLYWFEEQGVHDFSGEGLHGEKYMFEVFVRGVMVFSTNIAST